MSKYTRFIKALEKEIEKCEAQAYKVGKGMATCDTEDVWEWIKKAKRKAKYII